jgi:hypothetical protein
LNIGARRKDFSIRLTFETYLGTLESQEYFVIIFIFTFCNKLTLYLLHLIFSYLLYVVFFSITYWTLCIYFISTSYLLLTYFLLRPVHFYRDFSTNEIFTPINTGYIQTSFFLLYFVLLPNLYFFSNTKTLTNQTQTRSHRRYDGYCVVPNPFPTYNQPPNPFVLIYVLYILSCI